MKTFVVWHPDGGEKKEDGFEIKAHSYEDAAIKWAQIYTNGRQVTSGDTETIVVAEKCDAALDIVFMVEMHVSIEYFANEVKEK